MSAVGAGAVVSGLLLAAGLLVTWAPVRGRRLGSPEGAPWLPDQPRTPGPGDLGDRLLGRRFRERRSLGRRGTGASVPDQDLRAAAVAERAAALLRAGVAPEVAWEHAVDGGPDEVAAPVRAVWELVQRTGAPAAEALEASAAGVRADAAARAAVRTALAGARVSARTVSALPVLGLLLGAGLGAQPWAVLTGTPLGRVCAVLGVAMLLLGRWWSGRLVRTAAAAGR